MGSSPYWYFVPYEKDLNLALMRLREREFLAGRYNPVTRFPDFPVTDRSEAPGKRHGSIDEAIEAAADDGTRSILDLSTASDDDDFCVARVLSGDELEECFGDTHPTRAMIESDFGFLEIIERGKGICVTLYRDGEPDELLFAGYSFD